MKRIFFVLTAAMVIFSSCSKSEVSSPIQPSPQKQNEQKTVEEKGEANKNDNKQATKTSVELPKATTLLHIKNNKVSSQNYNVQYQVASNLPLKKGVQYDISITLKASAPTSISYSVGNWYPNNFSATIEATEEMKEYKTSFTAAVDGGFVLFQSGSFVGDIWIESVKITHKGSGKIVPLTADEKREVLSNAMDSWIAGMMDATDGYVKAWDVVNEALSGGDGDGDGIYDLQSYKNNNNADPTNVSSGVFYWQVYMGDLEYVRTAVASARKHFKGDPKDLKLFINDYNLESNWDNNGKLKSLIKWIKKWESDGITKIDGIGTQMHITCYEDANIQKSMEEHITNMFTLMAETGKLVRVSELDMGYKRGNNQWNGKNLGTSDLTAAEHQKMADFYEFILNEYFRIVPKAQQYGFCQWCLTDAPGPLGSGWRGGEPVGIWTQNFAQRKTVYKGFAQGLAERELSESVNQLGDLKTYIDRDKHGDFKFSGALDVNEFHENRNGISDIVAKNFDEIVAGNAMKYASCVNGGGVMNFSRVKQFVLDAKAKNLSIFGHTLAWHSQQQPGYLLGLMSDKEVEDPSGEKVDVVDNYVIYDKLSTDNMWHSNYLDQANNVDYILEIVKK